MERKRYAVVSRDRKINRRRDQLIWGFSRRIDGETKKLKEIDR
jgi:hypothetical protein